MSRLKYLIICASLSLGSHVVADESQKKTSKEPFESEAVQRDDYLEQEITIVEGPQSNRVEYRMNGILYAVKIIPSKGPAYYLVDQNGDGEFTNTQLDRQSSLKIPRWVIFRF